MLDPVRELSIAEVDAFVVPLREIVLGAEPNWTLEKRGHDELDDQSIHLGYVSENRIVGALRLTIKDSVRELPSSRYFPSCHLVELRAGELSRAVVDKAYRGRTVYPRLLAAGIARIIDEGANYIFAIVPKKDKDRKLYSDHGFSPIGQPFEYNDGIITISIPVVVVTKMVMRA
jgi:predicted GNAT family N-acyltransferase